MPPPMRKEQRAPSDAHSACWWGPMRPLSHVQRAAAHPGAPTHHSEHHTACACCAPSMLTVFPFGALCWPAGTMLSALQRFSQLPSSPYDDPAQPAHSMHPIPARKLTGKKNVLQTLCPWPAGFDSRFAGNAPADLAQLARPRYHIAGGQSIFFTRVPYANPDLGAGPRATRFISLGSVIPRLRHSGGRGAAAAAAPDAAAAAAGQQGMVGPGGATTAAAGGRGRAGIGHSGPDTQPAAAAAAGGGATAAAVADAAKKKFLHALALVPASSMSIEALGALPEGCGKYPYEQQQPQVGQKRSGGAYEHVSLLSAASALKALACWHQSYHQSYHQSNHQSDHRSERQLVLL